MKSLLKDDRGASKVVFVAIIIAVAVAGFAGWWLLLKDKNKSETQKAGEQAAKQIEASCTNPDKNICKFYAAMAKATNNMTITSAGTDINGTSATATMQFDNGKYSFAATGSYDIIVIGNDTYTKAGNTWWKKTTSPDESKAFDDFKFEDEATKPEAERQTYKLIGEEACGNLTCFKYQVTEPQTNGGNNVESQFLWIDTKDYLARKQTTTSGGEKSGAGDTLFTYGNAKVEIPSPVKDLPEGQVIYPGSTEPVPDPSASLGQ